MPYGREGVMRLRVVREEKAWQDMSNRVGEVVVLIFPIYMYCSVYC